MSGSPKENAKYQKVDENGGKDEYDRPPDHI